MSFVGVMILLVVNLLVLRKAHQIIAFFRQFFNNIKFMTDDDIDELSQRRIVIASEDEEKIRKYFEEKVMK